jgi:hypothetical protein
MMKTRKVARTFLSLVFPVVFFLLWAHSQQTPQTQPPAQTLKPDQSQPKPEGQQAQQSAQPQQAQQSKTEDVPVTDGGAGPCSVEFTVTDSDAKPVFSALINVHIAYGFAGLHKLDMSVYTNTQGKGKFTGIPATVRKPPLEFRATKGPLAGTATMNPALECQAKRQIVLVKSDPTP